MSTAHNKQQKQTLLRQRGDSHIIIVKMSSFQQGKEINRNYPWGSSDFGLTRQSFKINCLKYAQGAEGNHG